MDRADVIRREADVARETGFPLLPDLKQTFVSRWANIAGTLVA